MKLFLSLALILLSFSCKKREVSEDLTDYNWVLTSQVASPAVTRNGKTTTDYLSLENPLGCTSNFKFTFYPSGLFEATSNGPLCDMWGNRAKYRWTREGDQIMLNYNNEFPVRSFIKKEDTMTETYNITLNGSIHTIVSTYNAQKK
ncbi:MAG: hypothetical protein V4546_03315 [Bacteroidota bacterium]|uniref:Lipocalin-like domain-containing protein n=1 Tax=Pedobacter cryotolerans TaxID=2571270 RepID=A0A4U1CBA2_9SPHI|nr:hypothetical protein [Pedobacter cryotolerans]TKC03275.1 hypothetical protein FA045_01515 [Pedobacter cryotolerans]